ncbi:MAG: N-methyl-L-tryptophan oxidase [Actinomycetota bacterium]
MAHPSRTHDLAVVGLGAFGSAVAHHAAALGLDVVGLDRHAPPHDLGSSHAETRVTRLAVGEGDHYVPFAARSHELWRALESRIGDRILHDTGGLIIAPGQDSEDERWGDFVGATAAVAERAGLEFRRLSPEDARRDHPGYRIRDDEVVGFEPAGGLVMAEMAVAAQLDQARHHGADLRPHTTATAIDRVEGGVVVRTDTAADVWAREVVVCAGPWTRELADAARLRVTRQEVYWFEADLDLWHCDDAAFAIWAGRAIEAYLGVFAVTPNAPLQAVKLVPEQFDVATDPVSVDRTISDADVARFHETMVAPRLAGVSDRCVHRSVCLYTNTPDDHFLVDHHPETEAATIVSACSGHGFKHSAAVGEALARRAAGLDHLDLEPFRRDHRPLW